MALTHGERFVMLDAAADVVPWGGLWVKKISVECAAADAGGVTRLQRGSPLARFFDRTIFPGEVHTLDFARPQWMATLTAEAVGTGVKVRVEYA
jgi:hypothetical protein